MAFSIFLCCNVGAQHPVVDPGLAIVFTSVVAVRTDVAARRARNVFYACLRSQTSRTRQHSCSSYIVSLQVAFVAVVILAVCPRLVAGLACLSCANLVRVKAILANSAILETAIVLANPTAAKILHTFFTIAEVAISLSATETGCRVLDIALDGMISILSAFKADGVGMLAWALVLDHQLGLGRISAVANADVTPIDIGWVDPHDIDIPKRSLDSLLCRTLVVGLCDWDLLNAAATITTATIRVLDANPCHCKGHAKDIQIGRARGKSVGILRFSNHKVGNSAGTDNLAIFVIVIEIFHHIRFAASTLHPIAGNAAHPVAPTRAGDRHNFCEEGVISTMGPVTLDHRSNTVFWIRVGVTTNAAVARKDAIADVLYGNNINPPLRLDEIVVAILHHGAGVKDNLARHHHILLVITLALDDELGQRTDGVVAATGIENTTFFVVAIFVSTDRRCIVGSKLAILVGRLAGKGHECHNVTHAGLVGHGGDAGGRSCGLLARFLGLGGLGRFLKVGIRYNTQKYK